ncbi:MAG: cytochrome b/b6 domain-containing protein [Litorimonas sp.]
MTDMTAAPRRTAPTNSRTAYGSVERALHWAVAALLITGGVLGKVAYEWPYDTSAALSTKATLFSAHKTVGVTVFFLALFRIGWAVTQARPAPLHPDRTLETRLAATVHWLLYGSLVLVPLSGWAHHAASSGFAPIWWPFGQGLPFVPKDPVLSARLGELHELLVKVLIVSLLLHVAGTLKHVFVDRDLTLPRMWSGRDPETLPEHAKSALPQLAAAGIWSGALALGLILGAPQLPTINAGTIEAGTTEAPAEAAPAVQPADPDGAADGDWAVDDGTLAIEVLQMGQSVSGRFEDWDADIQFDDTVASGPVGRVTARVRTGSLTLGSVSSDAVGPDFLDAAGFPAAEYEAVLLRGADGYVADGALALRGETIPVRLPFTLEIDGDTAAMSGELVLDRRDFGIGRAYPDEENVGFSVTVRIDLTARRTR